METKICKKCGKTLPLEEFSKAKGTKDGRLGTCKKCHGAFQNTPEKLTCPVCKKELDYYYFGVAPASPTGRRWCCYQCYSNKPNDISDLSYRRRFDSKFKEDLNAKKRQEFKDNTEYYIWERTKLRAKKYGYEFNLDISDIKIPKLCPILEVEIIKGDKDNYEYSPSIDRIDNSKGYIKGNIWIISKKANSMKNSATPQELNTFCKNIIRYSLNNTENKCIELEDKELLG
jgi:hypothetical protein